VRRPPQLRRQQTAVAYIAERADAPAGAGWPIAEQAASPEASYSGSRWSCTPTRTARGAPRMPPRAAKRKRTGREADDAPVLVECEGDGKEADDAPVLVECEGEWCTPLKGARDGGLFLDACIAVGDLRIPAHKCVLCAHCPYLKALLTSSFAESESSIDNPVVLQGVNGRAVAAIVDCFYTGQISLQGATACAVIHAANFLNVSPIEAAACAFFVSRLEPAIAQEALAFSKQIPVGGANAQKFRSKCETYVATLAALPPAESLLNATQKRHQQLQSQLEEVGDRDELFKKAQKKYSQVVASWKKQAERAKRDVQWYAQNPKDRFGEDIAKLMDCVEQNGRRFQRKPIGPVGAFVQLKDEKWATAAEVAIGPRALRTIIVHSSVDEQLMEEMIKAAGV
jgi:hypothetical protein